MQERIYSKSLLIRSAWNIYRSDGLRGFVESTLRYMALYGRPDKVLRYWGIKLFGGNREVMVNVQGSRMMLNLRDRGIHTELYLNRIREPHATRYLQSILRPEWTVVDVGANIGYYVLIEARVVEQVYAFEPESGNYNNLMNNLMMNNCNVKTFPMAVGDCEGVTDFSFGKASNWNRICVGGLPSDAVVPMTTLDSYFPDMKVDFIRMDVEGYEMAVLQGARNMIEKWKPQMFIEVHQEELKDYGSSQEELLTSLAGHGYSLTRSFILNREGPSGRLKDLLANEETKKIICTKGIASHMFFGMEKNR